MDEPLSNLDAKLRVQMRAEIQKLQRALGVTTIYVTHDQTEAMTMGDRIAVMRGGTLQQVDTPERVYRSPANQFVAGFIGSPSMNMASGRLSRADGALIVSFGAHSLALDDELLAAHPVLASHDGQDVVVGIRPEDIEDASFVPPAAPLRTLATTCSLREALGSEVLVHFPIAGADGGERGPTEIGEPLADAGSIFVARVHPQTAARMGEPVQLVVDTRKLHFFDPATGLAIRGGSR
jgi:multiple sugar transport system ATP-binding protein